MSNWKIWCDGSCAPTNPGPCAWGSVIQSPDGGRTEHFGFIQAMGTNNIAELTAAIESLRKTPEGALVVLCSDSQYTLKGLGEWLPGWIKKGWRTASGSAVLNKELWQALHKEYLARKVKLEWVRVATMDTRRTRWRTGWQIEGFLRNEHGVQENRIPTV